MKVFIALACTLMILTGCATDQSIDNEPCISNTGNTPSKKLQDSIYNPQKERFLWADSWLYAEAPELEVETWLTDKPDTTGKYVLIEFWGTYCPPCRKFIPTLNEWHQKYKDELVIIGISHEPLETVKDFKEHNKIDYYSAVDTQARTKNKMNVFGVPHVIIIEPQSKCIIWEGFPLQKNYELTETTIKNILAVGRKLK